MKKEELWGWIFQYNPYMGKYMGATRENARELVNGDKGNVLYGNTIKQLETQIIKNERIKNKFGQ